MKKLLAGSGIVAVVLALGLSLGYWHFSGLMPGGQAERAEGAGPGPSAPVGAVPPPEPDAPQAAGNQGMATQGLADDADDAARDAASITLLRVEPDGSALLAGRAAPDGEVVIRSGDTVLAREDVSAGGDFVVTLDEPLAVGDHELTLETLDADGRSTLSPEVAIVSVPDPERPEDLLVAVGSPDAPTRLLAVPAPADEPAPDDAAPSDTAMASLRGSAEETGPMPATPQSTLPAGDLSIAAVEIEDERLFVAGSSRPGSTIRVYLDDEFVAEADDAGEQFIAEAIAEVPVGPHVVRADEIGPDGRVIARAEVPFERPEGARMAALSPRFEAPEAAPTPPAAPAAGPAIEPEVPEAASARAEAGPPVQQAALEPVEGRVIIRRGDTLWRISRQTYGQGSRYTTIYLANGDQIRDPDLIYPGQIFRMPAEPDEGARPAG